MSTPERDAVDVEPQAVKPTEPEARPEPRERGPRIHLSAAALDNVREMIREAGLGEEGGLRLTARPGAGCSAPLRYGMFLEEAPEDDDTVLRAGGVRLFLDPESAWVLDGLFVDYVSSSPMGEGFAFRHPNGRRGRAC